jgi:hypothetical protein
LEITGPPEAKAATRSFSADKCTVAANLYAGGPGAPQTLVAAANLDCIREIRRYPRLAKHEFKKDLCLRVHFVISIIFNCQFLLFTNVWPQDAHATRTRLSISAANISASPETGERSAKKVT